MLKHINPDKNISSRDGCYSMSWWIRFHTRHGTKRFEGGTWHFLRDAICGYLRFSYTHRNGLPFHDKSNKKFISYIMWTNHILLHHKYNMINWIFPIFKQKTLIFETINYLVYRWLKNFQWLENVSKEKKCSRQDKKKLKFEDKKMCHVGSQQKGS